MNYTQEMNLVSKSGYCMPFEERNGEVNMTLGYGKQNHPVTQEDFFITVWISPHTATSLPP